VDVVSAAEMEAAAKAAFATADAAICAAAVADYPPAAPADHKLKKGREELTEIRLVRTTDILAELSRGKGHRVVIGFAAETGDLLSNAWNKLAHKGCDLIVANDVSRKDSTFGSDTDRVSFVSAEGIEEQPTLPKREVAALVAQRLATLLDERNPQQER
jgi:phosphopantothenoylcysteine decarboxylase/phosphopantothenate--cysteine ligase